MKLANAVSYGFCCHPQQYTAATPTHPNPPASFKSWKSKGLDTRWAVAHSPKLLQGAMAGVCDYYTFGLALRAFGSVAAGWALLFQVLSWFNFYCLVRPYSNSAEAVLATAALYYWAPHFLSAAAAAAATKDGTTKSAPPMVDRGSIGGAGRNGDSGHLNGGGVGSDRWGGGVPSSSSSLSSASPWDETCALLLASFCVAVRPTSAALWVRFALPAASYLVVTNGWVFCVWVAA